MEIRECSRAVFALPSTKNCSMNVQLTLGNSKPFNYSFRLVPSVGAVAAVARKALKNLSRYLLGFASLLS